VSRIAIAALAGLVLVPLHASAASLVSLEFLNSNLTFGLTTPGQFGYDLDLFDIDGDGTSDVYGTFDAAAGPLVSETINPSDPTTATYLYRGGTFSIDLSVNMHGQSLTGSFVAPIQTLQVTATDPAGGCDVFAVYTLGAGLFDRAFATALGLPSAHTLAGANVLADLIIDSSNPTGLRDAIREAEDGATFVTLPVPEPPVGLTAAIAFALVLWSRKRGPLPARRGA
jgi:hypothetical protein